MSKMKLKSVFAVRTEWVNKHKYTCDTCKKSKLNAWMPLTKHLARISCHFDLALAHKLVGVLDHKDEEEHEEGDDEVKQEPDVDHHEVGDWGEGAGHCLVQCVHHCQ